VTESQDPRSSADDARTLSAFLAGEQADWKALARDLERLSGQQDDPTRQALLTLVDFLVHSDRSQGTPREVREFLDPAEGQLAASVFRRAMEHEPAWRDFAREAERLLGEEGGT
jgi:hypothetical protein